MSLLESILAESLPVFTGSDIAKIRSELKAGTFRITDPTIIKPKLFPETIAEKEALLKKLDPEGYKKYYNVRNTPDWKKIDADIIKNKAKQKQRAAALKRKRDKSGHFLPGKVSK